MDLFDKIGEDIKQAMLAKESVKLEAIRSVKKEFIEAKTSKNGDGTLSDEKAIQIIQKLIKQRKESATLFSEQNRDDLAERELLEASFIEAYLPEQMGEHELESVIKTIIAQLGASSVKDMGKVMGVASKQLAGKTDGKSISEMVKRCLAC